LIHFYKRNMPNETNSIPDHRKYWESHDFTITKTVIEEGDIDTWKPRFGSTAIVSYTIIACNGVSQNQLCSDKLLSNYFALSPCELVLGSAHTEIDRQLERCVESCYLNQLAQFNMRALLEPEYNGRVGSCSTTDSEPQWISIELELKLESLLNADPIYKWFNETKLSKAREFHSLGVKLFKEKRILDAFHMFKIAYKLSVLARGIVEDNFADAKDAEELQNLCYNNLAACHFQWKNFKSVVELSEKVIQNQPNNVKTLYRKGVANMELGEYEDAEKDLIAGRKLEPSNRAVNEKLGQVQQRKKTAEAKMSQRMKKMFPSGGQGCFSDAPSQESEIEKNLSSS